MDHHNKILQTGWLKQQKRSNSSTWKSEMGRFDLFWGLSPWLAEGHHANVLTWSRLF